MTSPEQLPEDVSDLFIKYRDQKASKEEQIKLFKWIDSMRKVPGFNLKDLVEAGFGYAAKDYTRLRTALTRFRKMMKVTARDELRRLENQDFATFIENMWNEAKTIATEVVMAWREKALNMGYFDEETGKVKMKAFIMDAVNFYIENKDRLEELQEQMRDIEAAGRLAFRLADPNIAKIYVINAYTRFCAEVLKLAAMGIPVPESVILDVKETVNQTLLSFKQPLMRGLEEYG